MKTDKTFKSHFQGLRKSLGKTQKEVCKSVGISDMCYKQYEYGQRFPNVRTAMKIARVLEVSVEDIWGPKHLSSDYQ